jgi:class 3 adenylate cyclase
VPLAAPGTVVISAAARDALPDGAAVALGEHRLKGFDDPVTLFALRPPA